MPERRVAKLIDNWLYFWFDAGTPVAKFNKMFLIPYFIHLAKIML
jgi:hypothetical protein